MPNGRQLALHSTHQLYNCSCTPGVLQHAVTMSCSAGHAGTCIAHLGCGGAPPSPAPGTPVYSSSSISLRRRPSTCQRVQCRSPPPLRTAKQRGISLQGVQGSTSLPGAT